MRPNHTTETSQRIAYDKTPYYQSYVLKVDALYCLYGIILAELSIQPLQMLIIKGGFK
jgi:hypothetical protein